MGTLFPDSDEYPDYKPFPRTTTLGLGGRSVISVAVTCTLFGLCSIEEAHAHPIHEDHQPVDYRVTAMASSSSTSDPGAFIGSTDNSDVIRRHHERLRAAHRAATSSGS